MLLANTKFILEGKKMNTIKPKNKLLAPVVTVLLLACALVALMCPVALAEDNTTYDNLFASVHGETSAAAAYRAFAIKAQEEGYPVIAQLFRATADAEQKHAADEWAILLTMGATAAEHPVADIPVVGTTAQNLLAAFEGETYEYTVMYPEFRATALAEGNTFAASIFRLAMEAERIHAGNYKDVLENLGDKAYIKATYSVVYRCIICGEVVTERPTNCPICRAAGDTFVEYAYLPIDVVPTASVEKLTGNKNNLTITITEYYSDGNIDIITKTFSIDNNAAATYTIEDYKVYKVYVDTKGNIQIRECYIVN
jgi:rubrerythrin